jgi:hypothetical protein
VAANRLATKILCGAFKDRKGLKHPIRAAWLDCGGDDMTALFLNAEPNRSLSVAFATDRDAVKSAVGRLLFKPIAQAFASARDKAGVVRGRFIVSAEV